MQKLKTIVKAGVRNFCLFLLVAMTSATAVQSRNLPSGPAASIRVDFDGEIISVTAIQGLSNRASGRALMPDDPVRIASISKLFVALAVMRLVEAGTLDLHRDVNDYLGWDLRNPAFPDQSITLAHLLSHQAGLRDGINYALPMDALLAEELKDPKAWDANRRAGSFFTYANLNSPVIAAIMEAATGLRFDRIMQSEVFAPLELDACFNWINCSNHKINGAVTLYRPNGNVARDDLRGVREKCSVVPARDGSCDLSKYRLGQTGSVFSPQGGLRISAVGLAKVGQMFLKQGAEFLSRETIAKMRAPRWIFDGTNGQTEGGYFCAYGLGMHILNYSNPQSTRPQAAKPHPECRDQPFHNGYSHWGHSGEAYSLKSGFWFNNVENHGTVFFRTEVPEDDPTGHCIYQCK